MDRLIAETRDRLRLLDARLDEAVTRAIELSVRAQRTEDLGGLADIDSWSATWKRCARGSTRSTPRRWPHRLPRPTEPPQRPKPDPGTPAAGTA